MFMSVYLKNRPVGHGGLGVSKNILTMYGIV